MTFDTIEALNEHMALQQYINVYNARPETEIELASAEYYETTFNIRTISDLTEFLDWHNFHHAYCNKMQCRPGPEWTLKTARQWLAEHQAAV